MSETSIYPEVRKIIADKIDNGEVVIVDWLTHEIIASKAGIEGPDTEFYRVCAFTHVKDVVKRCVGKYDAKPSTDRQLVLSGFEYLQVAYSLMREGEIAVKSQVQVLPGDDSGASAKGGPTGMGRSDGGERPATNSPSAANPVEAVADKPQAPRPSVTAPHAPDHATPAGDDDRPSEPSPNDAGAKIDGLPSVVGQDGEQPGIHHGKSGQEDASATQARDEPGSVSGATVTNLNPRCQKPDTCKWAHSQSSCSDCNSAWMKARVA